MLSIALGVTVIITVLSVLNGFKSEIQNKILDFTSHAVVTSPLGRVHDQAKLKTLIQQQSSIESSAPFVEMQAMLTAGEQVSGAYIRGVLPQDEKQISNTHKYMTKGSIDQLQSGAWNIIIGSALANYLRVDVGDKITLLSPEFSHTPAGMIPKMRRFTIAGIFQTGMSQYDRNIALLHLEEAQKIGRYGDSISGFYLRYPDLFKAPQISNRLNQVLEPDYWVSDWTQRNRSFFKALEMEKLILFIIMALIIAVAAFNIVSTLIMLVIEKQGDIAVLKTMGMTSQRIMKIFITQGCLIGSSGAILGIGGGSLLAIYLEDLIKALETFLGQKFLSPNVYPITEVPSQLMVGDIVVTALLAFILTLFSTLYPAWKASRIRPYEALRYE